ncbi:hypothetical protein, partial [Specibacter cremeus]|uniref:hypothetical protein n=1 Tax=Specibacter cremeus TaxID=1629051 RepID=UPI00197C49BB
MAKIKVGSGFGKATLQAALQRAKPGDLLVLDPGRYNLDQVTLFGLGLHGNGTADQVEIMEGYSERLSVE